MSRWSDPTIVDDPRIHQDDHRVRAIAEYQHSNESMHRHPDIPDSVCPYCALSASRAVDVLRELGVLA